MDRHAQIPTRSAAGDFVDHADVRQFVVLDRRTVCRPDQRRWIAIPRFRVRRAIEIDVGQGMPEILLRNMSAKESQTVP